ncbi:uncharacterized protein M421DRAFT_392973 [Didymella exigua CBS 183.55]|uniref:Uncharacterized protein n=1 Tax=Didymella exigua CBS 183.55 TaxID=1150837 RepID=A0A6A5R8G1_9PLEO|nr:uncharacterized protein M421DRAFT_392973 [Didymella exigua CBS 183.55]KAF1922127.1 hypothetical protein M421DRAFT_392973 [Didymella exigua CBS 183.55]
MSYSGGPTGVSNKVGITSPVGSDAAGYNSCMKDPNNSAIRSSSTGDTSITTDAQKLQQKIVKVGKEIQYHREQFEGAKEQFNEILSVEHMYT